jgi:putative nucleotidyltransferase with HDIG domain
MLEEGDVASQDIRAPRPITYESAIRTAEQRRLAVDAVSPVYTQPDSAVARDQLERTQQVLDYLVSVRADQLASVSQKRAWVMAVPEFGSLEISTEAVDTLLSISEESWGRVQLEVLDVVAETMRVGVREGSVEEAQGEIVSQVGLDLTIEEAAVTASLAERLIVPNTFYDEAATLAERERVRDSVTPVLRSIEVDEVIVREGQRVGPLDLEAMRELGLQQTRTSWADVAGYAAISLASVALLGMVLARYEPDVLWQGGKLLLLTILLVLFVLLARLMVPDRMVLRYLYPAASLGMLVAASLGTHVGLAASAFVAGMFGLIGDHSLELVVFVSVGGAAAALALSRSDRPVALFRSAGVAMVAQMMVLVGFRVLQQRPEMYLDLALQLMMVLGNGIISSSMALGGLFLVGPLFDIVTTFRLIELSRPEHPLLQRLLREAPGTYHHSLMVANLAEQAAERIGANPLLTRVGAYYHDIGKVVRPYFFIENQVKGLNPHERLDPYTSSEIITGHVRDGLQLARRYRLPQRVRAFIPEHHGSNRTSFQYRRAVELAGDAELVNEQDFKHQGPRPQSKETALVMLADSCEATVRARRPPTPQDLAQVVNEVFDRLVAAEQLDECPLTIRDLDVVRKSFVSTLRGVLHPRIRYPEPVAPALEHGASEPVAPLSAQVLASESAEE